jgi:hypothetical protein
MTKSAILGHIDCPTCGTVAGMRITHDKNSEPFGYCEFGCRQQLRIGGDKSRVTKFVSRYGWAAGLPVTVTGTANSLQKPVTVTGTANSLQKPVTVPVTEPKRRSTMDDALAMLGVARAKQ